MANGNSPGVSISFSFFFFVRWAKGCFMEERADLRMEDGEAGRRGVKG